MPMDVFGWRFYQAFPLFGTNSRTDICIRHKGAAAAHNVSCSRSRASASGVPVRVFYFIFSYFLFPQILLLWEYVWPAGLHTIGAKSERVTSSVKLSFLYSFLSLNSFHVSTKYQARPKYKEIYSDAPGENSTTWIIIKQTVFCIKAIQGKSFRRKLVIMW